MPGYHARPSSVAIRLFSGQLNMCLVSASSTCFSDRAVAPALGQLDLHLSDALLVAADGEIEVILQAAKEKYPGVDPGWATFGTLICSHLAGTKFYKLDSKTFTFAVKKGFFRTPGLPPRVEAKIPSVCIGGSAGGHGKPLRLPAVHSLSAEPSQRAVHAGRPHLLGRHLHVSNPQFTRGAG